MYTEQRQARIRAEINETGSARITDTGHRLGVTPPGATWKRSRPGPGRAGGASPQDVPVAAEV
jgi:hypothetical protein